MIIPTRMKNITGLKFGSLTAIRPSKLENRTVYWEYKCECGNLHVARANTVTYASKKGDPMLPSCGCVELARKTKHGFRTVKNTHPAYRAYRGMLSRCYNPNDPGYQWYGAVGVTVCDEWKGNPEAFVKWALDNGWKKGMHVDKDILSDAKQIHPHIYSPETCQWVPAKKNVGYATNRDNFGKHPNVRLSHQQVEELLELFNSGEETNTSRLAERFNLKSRNSVYRLIKLHRDKVQSNA